MLNVEDKLGEMITKSAPQRGLIIEGGCAVESLMDTIILSYFAKKEKQGEFYQLVLANENFTIRFKRELLDQIGLFDHLENKNRFKEKLERIFTIRNKAAHSRLVLNELGQPLVIKHSKKRNQPNNVENLDELEKEMLCLCQEVTPILSGIIKRVL